MQRFNKTETCLRHGVALVALVLTVVIPTVSGAVISLNAPLEPATHAWQNPCASQGQAVDGLSLVRRARRDVEQQRGALSSIITRLDDTLHTIDLVQDQSDDIDTYVVALYRSLARVASYLHHMRDSLANHEHRFSYRRLLALLRILENGGVVSAEVNNGGIYHIMCDIYRLVATSGGDTSDLTIDEIDHEHPKTMAQLHDKFFIVLKSTQSLVRRLQRTFPVGF